MSAPCIGRSGAFIVALLVAGLAPQGARAAGGFIEPERLTSGAADQFLAVMDPRGERVIYVSNENATTEIWGAEMSVRAPERLFDESADVTWPRVSPDGHKLLYLSFRTEATGQLCLRDLPREGLTVSDAHCLSLGEDRHAGAVGARQQVGDGGDA